MRAAFFLFLAVLFAALPGLPAEAQGRRAPGVRTLDQILPEIRRSHPGQFYDADGPTDAPDGSSHYHLKWLTPDGRVEWLDTDARTGRVLGTSPGRDNFDAPGAGPSYAPAPSYRVQPGFSERFRGNGFGGNGFRGNGYGGYPASRAQGYDGGRDSRDRRGRDRGR